MAPATTVHDLLTEHELYTYDSISDSQGALTTT